MPQNPADALSELLTREAVASAFDYLRAVLAGDTRTAGDLVAAEPRMPAFLTGVAEGIVEAGTSLPGPDDDAPTWDSFALEALGKVFLRALRRWQQPGPDAAPGIAQTVIDFATAILCEEHYDIAHELDVYELCAKGQLRLDARAASAAAYPVDTTTP